MADKSKKPGKLFALKEWLTLEDAARHLSLLFDEEVSVADVLRLTLDGRLTLSVWFVNHARAIKGRLGTIAEVNMQVLPGYRVKELGVNLGNKLSFTHEELKEIYPSLKGYLDSGEIFLTPDAIHYQDGQYLIQEKQVTSIRGIWDLPMLAGERLDVEHRFQMETGGPAVTLVTLEGAFVERDGVICQLQESFEDNEYQAGSKASLEALKERIECGEIAEDKAKELLEKHRKDREIFTAKPPSYYPSAGLPSDAVWIVKTAALREFEASVLSEPSRNEKPVGKREVTSLLNITGGLLGLLLGATPSGRAQSVFKDQNAVIEALLSTYVGKAGIAKRTLEEKFAEAKRSLSSS